MTASIGLGGGVIEEEEVLEQEVPSRDFGTCVLSVEVVGVEIRIFVKIPFNLIVMISPGTMLCGTLTRNRFSFEGISFGLELSDASPCGSLIDDAKEDESFKCSVSHGSESTGAVAGSFIGEGDSGRCFAALLEC